jgi:hypothetical protein
LWFQGWSEKITRKLMPPPPPPPNTNNIFLSLDPTKSTIL